MRFIVLFTFVFSLHARAQDSLSLVDRWVEMALQNNPSVQAAGYQAQAAEMEVRMEKTMPDPMLMSEFRGIPLGFDPLTDTSEWMLMLEQAIPFPGKLAKMERRADAMAAVQQSMAESVRREIVAQVKILYYNLALMDQDLQITGEQITLLRQFIEISRSRYTSGTASYQELLRATAELTTMETRQIAMEQERKTIAAHVNRLLNRPLNTPIDRIQFQEKLVPIQEEQLSLAIQSHPMILAAKEGLRQSEVELKLAKIEALPEVKLMGGYMVMNDMPDAWMGRISVSLPFMPWSRQDNKARIQRSEVLIKQHAADLEDITQEVTFMTIEARNMLKSLSDQISLYETKILPAYQQNLDLSVTQYQTGQMKFLDLLKDARELLDKKMQWTSLVASYHKTVVLLEKFGFYQVRG